LPVEQVADQLCPVRVRLVGLAPGPAESVAEVVKDGRDDRRRLRRHADRYRHVYQHTLETSLLKSAWKHVYDGLKIERLASAGDKRKWKWRLVERSGHRFA